MDLTLEARKRSINYSFTGLFTYIQQAWDFPVQRTKCLSSSIYKHYHLQHNSEMPERLIEQFNVIAKCNGKFDCLVKEMLYIRMRKPTLNVQTDSIRAKVFV